MSGTRITPISYVLRRVWPHARPQHHAKLSSAPRPQPPSSRSATPTHLVEDGGAGGLIVLVFRDSHVVLHKVYGRWPVRNKVAECWPIGHG